MSEPIPDFPIYCHTHHVYHHRSAIGPSCATFAPMVKRMGEQTKAGYPPAFVASSVSMENARTNVDWSTAKLYYRPSITLPWREIPMYQSMKPQSFNMPTEDKNPAQTAMIRQICIEQVDLIVEKDNTYMGAWKKRGGTGAFHQGIARCWDRIEGMLEPRGYDIFSVLQEEINTPKWMADGSLSATMRDLRSYLLLAESHIRLLSKESPAPKKCPVCRLYSCECPEEPSPYLKSELNRPSPDMLTEQEFTLGDRVYYTGTVGGPPTGTHGIVVGVHIDNCTVKTDNGIFRILKTCLKPIR